MKKLFTLMAMFVLLLVSSVSFASVGVRMNGTIIGAAGDINLQCDPGSAVTADGFSYNVGCNNNFVTAGTANGGATSMATADLTISLAYSFIRKAIAAAANPGFSASTLANGEPGQILSIQISAVGSGGTWTVTPTTSTGFSSIQFNTYNVANPQKATFLYVNDTIGWIILNIGGSTVPTVFDANGK